MLSKPISPHVKRIYSAVEAPRLDTRLGIDSEIAYSWRRCLADFGLDPARRKTGPLILEAATLRERRDRMDEVLTIARPAIENMFRQLGNSGICALLTDADGVVLEALAEEGDRANFERAGLWLGADWSEASEGTNGIGTALSESRPVTVHLEDHFQPLHTGLTCSGAPLYGPNGEVLGVLDVSATSSRDSKQGQRATLALVHMTNLMISKGLFMRQYRNQFVICLHPVRHYLGLVCEGLIAVSGEGRILAMNHNATQLLQLENGTALIGRTVDSLFENDFDDLIRVASARAEACFELKQADQANTFFARLEIPSPVSVCSRPDERPQAPARDRRPAHDMSLDHLSHGDENLGHIIACARRVMNRDIPILILGETGSGKEALAKAIHCESNRQAQNFVAVNCASIPESLIESELFGYKSGAFTGARRDGMRGKLVQSSGGTLFLDEIGDMPLALQTRLLRVLEDGLVYPLGSETPVPVELHVIAATHRDMDSMVEEGSFRQDLYFRLNGISLQVPPLSQRQDIQYIIGKLLEAEAEHADIVVDPEVYAMLAAFDWPGNIRQLRNVIRVALALGDHRHVTVEHLPLEVRSQQTRSGTRVSAPDAGASMNGIDRALANTERQTLVAELERSRWNVSKAAKGLGISRATLYRKMKRHGLDKG